MPARRIALTYLITDLQVGGVPLHLYRLVTRLPADWFAVRVISLADVGPVGEQLRAAGIRVVGCGARSVRDLSALARLHRLLRAERVDVLHGLLFHANIAARLVGPLAGIPPRRIITEIQTVEIERLWHLTVDNLTCRLSAFEAGNSPSVVEHLHRHARVPRSRLRCMWGAVDLAAIDAARPVDRHDLGVEPGDRLLLWTGRMDPIKGFEQMLAAVARTDPSWRIRLLLAGDGPYRPQVQRLIHQLELADRVRLLGMRRDVPGLLRAADGFLFCSRTEGLPNALLEAMAAGLPIIATDVPGCRDLIQHGCTGMLVQAGDVTATAAALASWVHEPARMSALSRAARQWVAAHADLTAMSRHWANVYHDLAGYPTRRP